MKPRRALAGVRLKLLVVDDPGLAAAAERLRGEWHSSTGAEFEIFEMTEAELRTAEQIECDAVVFPTHDLGELADRGWLLPFPHPRDRRSRFRTRLARHFETIRKTETVWGDHLYNRLHHPSSSALTEPIGSKGSTESRRGIGPNTRLWLSSLNHKDVGNSPAVIKTASSEDSVPTIVGAICGAIEPWGAGCAGLTLLALRLPTPGTAISIRLCSTWKRWSPWLPARLCVRVARIGCRQPDCTHR